MKRNIIITLLVIIYQVEDITCQTCQAPQKGLYISYNAMSKKDTMTDLFNEVNTKIPNFNLTSVEQQTRRSILNLHPELHYNQHYQKQTFATNYTIHVELGKIELFYKFDYQVANKTDKKIGVAYGKTLIDAASFVKRIIFKQGTLQWDPQQISDLKSSNLMHIESSDPKLPFLDFQKFQNMLNGDQEGRKIKQQIMSIVNGIYKPLLKTHLNNQHVTNNATIKYTFKNYTYKFVNVIKNFSISFNKLKGLQVLFFFQLENKTTECAADHIEFSEENYGGLQQIYSMTTLKNVFYDALNNGLFDVILNKDWQVKTMQFFMGDLTQSISGSKNYIPDDPFTVSCKFDKNASKPNLDGFSDTQIYVQASQKCTLIHKEKQLIQINTLIYFVVNIIPQDEILKFVISKSGIYTLKYKSIDPKFVVTNEALFKFQVQSIVKGLNSSIEVLGSGWQTMKRRFPGIHIPNKQYIVIFDASQI